MTAKCICDPGYGGDRCDKAIEWVQFAPGAKVQYATNIAFSTQTNDIELLFIPGRVSSSTAELGYGTDRDLNSVSTNVDNYMDRLTATAAINLGPSPTNLRLTEVALKENASYWMQFTRNPTRTTLSIDGNYRTSQILDPTSSQQSFVLQVRDIFLGNHDSSRGFMVCHSF